MIDVLRRWKLYKDLQVHQRERLREVISHFNGTDKIRSSFYGTDKIRFSSGSIVVRRWKLYKDLQVHQRERLREVPPPSGPRGAPSVPRAPTSDPTRLL